MHYFVEKIDVKGFYLLKNENDKIKNVDNFL